MGLCHACHNFIHNGRLLMLLSEEKIPADKFWSILAHGFTVLIDGHCELNRFAVHAWEKAVDELGIDEPDNFPVHYGAAMKFYNLDEELKRPTAPWGAWRLILDGKEYEPLHATYEQWQTFYDDENE